MYGADRKGVMIGWVKSPPVWFITLAIPIQCISSQAPEGI